MSMKPSSSGDSDLREQIKQTSSGEQQPSSRHAIVAFLILLLLLVVLGAVGAVVYFSQPSRAATPPTVVAVATKESTQPISLSFPTLPPLNTATLASSATANFTATLVTINSAADCNLRAGVFVVGGDTASVEIINDGLSTLTITDLTLEWPSEDGRLAEIQFGDSKIAAPDDASPLTQLPTEFAWRESGNRGLAGKAKQTLMFKFTKPARALGYAVKLKFDRSCELMRSDRITDTPSITPSRTLTRTQTSTSAPTRTASRTPSPTLTPKGFIASATSPKLAPTFTPGCSIILNGPTFSGNIIRVTITNREAAPVTLEKLNVQWPEKELDLIRLDRVLIWNAEDFQSPTIIPDESHWLGGRGRTIPPGAIFTLELEFEGGDALAGEYHSIGMTFDNGCFRSLSN